MKKALIVTVPFLGRSLGQVYMVAEDLVIDGLAGGYYDENMVKVSVPDELSVLPIEVLKGVLVEGQWEVQRDDVKFALNDKAMRISEKYNLLQTEVYSEMAKIFGTTKSDSATANLITWMRMLERPAFFAGKGIVCKFDDLIGIDLGENLNTIEKVTDYATQLTEKADAYAVWRECRIQQFTIEKASIEAE